MRDYAAIHNPDNIPAEHRVYLSPHPKTEQAWCGHKLDPARAPKTNCDQCWTYYFIHPGNVKTTQALIATLEQPNGDESVSRVFGGKFVKKLQRFVVLAKRAKEVTDIINQRLEEEAETEELAKATDEVNPDQEYDIVFPGGAWGEPIEKEDN